MKHIKWIIGILIVVLLISFFNKQDVLIKEQNQNVFTIAAILPLTGPAAEDGEQMKEGLLLAFEEINKEEKKVELIIEDSKSKPGDAVSAFNKIKNTQRPDIYITALSAVSMALKPLIEEDKTPALAIVTYAPELTKDNTYFNRFFNTVDKDVPLIVDNAKTLGVNNVGILHLNNEYGNSVNEQLSEALNLEGITTESDSFLVTDQDMKNQLFKFKNKNLESIYIVGYAGHVMNGVRQAKEIKYSGEILAANVLPHPLVLGQLDNEITNGLLSTYPKISEDFRNIHQLKYDRQPSYLAANAYAVVYLIVDNLIGKENNSENILNRLKNIPSSYQTVLGPIYQEDREISFDSYPVEIQNGEVIYK